MDSIIGLHNAEKRLNWTYCEDIIYALTLFFLRALHKTDKRSEYDHSCIIFG